MLAVGGLLGAISSGTLAEKFGRRDSMLFMNALFVIGAVLISTSTTSAQFAIGRIFVGVTSGFMVNIQILLRFADRKYFLLYYRDYDYDYYHGYESC